MALCKAKVPRTVQRWPGGQAWAVLCTEPVGEQLLRATSCTAALMVIMARGLVSKQLLGQGRVSRGGGSAPSPPAAATGTAGSRGAEPWQQQQGKGKAASGN